jgi:integrase/recombinase XerC
LNKLLRFANGRDISQWSDIDEKTLNLFVMELRHANVSNRSIRRHLSSTRGFFSYLLSRGELDENYAKTISSPKLGHTLPKTLDFEDLSRMMQPKSNRLDELRNVAMIELIYSSALRVSELVGLNINDLDFREGFIKVLGKGAKARFVPVGKGAISAVENYLIKRPICENSALFVNQKL